MMTEFKTPKVLQPVLVRNAPWEKWRADIFSYRKSPIVFHCLGGDFHQILPLEGNEKLLGRENCSYEKFEFGQTVYAGNSRDHYSTWDKGIFYVKNDGDPEPYSVLVLGKGLCDYKYCMTCDEHNDIYEGVIDDAQS